MTDARVELVGAGYDVIADRFVEWSAEIEDAHRSRWRQELVERLPAEARVLELGCGAGLADTRILAERFRVTGVDVSVEQIGRARVNVPAADFVLADFTQLELAAASFDAVAAFYSFNHVPRDTLPQLLGRIHSWLVPGGLFLAAFGTGDTESWTGEWLGTTMFFSSYPPDTNRTLLVDAGFELLLEQVATIVEPEPDGEATFQWVLARR
jgi:cyclopropane fatty-acyl-phospholipid synthase-like methyltransferase